ncbi:hypothetical protein [Desulfosarcina sp.]|uniref:hypothetical protein n=1 Tax=Desulfosarcina sp. TaxID=2027861 RepID=UPI0029B56DF5|nr:hypothetical protein [Desulfosarcina sp.]MDX2452082.1 hypothetical protein [Desulfosarcina sp.]MDX2489873.1 hypothetical protein [Desulfosarcina sp.]
MIDFILAGLSAGLLAFLTLFIISFVTLGLITGVIHLVTLVYRSLVFGKTATYEEQAA